jgi:hypothetical protein
MQEPLLKVLKYNKDARAVYHMWLHDEINIFCFKFIILPTVVLPDLNCAEILEQSMRSRNRVGIGCRTGSPGYIGWRAGTTTRFFLGS